MEFIVLSVRHVMDVHYNPAGGVYQAIKNDDDNSRDLSNIV